MRRSEGIDWRAWVALAWALAFGLLYANSLIRDKLPVGWASPTIRRSVGDAHPTGTIPDRPRDRARGPR